MNHRSKNMLALVQALARQTVAKNPQDFKRWRTSLSLLPQRK
ncbi:MAG: HWE histidine kinase domain-containing protein [Rhodomicrobium sp.]